MAARSLAEAESEAALGDERDGRLGAPVRRPRCGDERRLGRALPLDLVGEGVDGRREGVEDRLVADAAPPAAGESGGACPERGRQEREVRPVVAVEREAAFDEGRSVERPAGAADAGDEDVADPADDRAEILAGAGGCSVKSRWTAWKPAIMLAP